MKNDNEPNTRPELKLNDPNNLILIDGSGYIFRAFYGLPPMTNPEGIPVNAVFGFTKMLLKLIDDLKPMYAAVILMLQEKLLEMKFMKIIKEIDPTHQRI